MTRKDAIQINYKVGQMLVEYQNTFPVIWKHEGTSKGDLYARLHKLRYEIADILSKYDDY